MLYIVRYNNLMKSENMNSLRWWVLTPSCGQEVDDISGLPHKNVLWCLHSLQFFLKSLIEQQTKTTEN